MNKANTNGRSLRLMVALLMLGALLTGCSTMRSGAHHDEAASFDHYRSFAWIAGDPLIVGEGEQPAISPLAKKKIVQAIENELGTKGFAYSENPDQADFVVAFTVGTRDKITARSYPTRYYGTWGWHLYGRYYYQTEVVQHSYTEGTLGIDIFDAKTKQPVWHGWASKTVTSADRNDPSPAIKSAVAAIIKRFPPTN